MRKLRVTAAHRRRVADMRDSVSGSARRGGVMVIPRMLSVEEWEKVSLASQERLIAEARDSIPAVQHPPALEDVTHRHKVTR